MPARDPTTGRFVSGGQSVGQAVGSIGIDTSGVVQAQRTVETASQQMTKAFTSITSPLDAVAKRFQNARNEAEAFKKTSLGQIQQGVDGLARALTPVSLAAGALVAGGIAAARQLQILNAQMVVFTGSQAKATQLQAKLHDIAKDTGQAYVDVAQGALQILPIIGRTNTDLGQTLSVVQRLAALNSEQGTAGAGLAIRELLTGQTRSLINRFNLAPSDINAITKQAGGDPQKIIAGLSGVLDKLGLTQEAFNNLNKSGVNAFSQLKGEVTEALGTAFTPLLQNFVLPAVQGFSALVRQVNETNPAFLQAAAGGAVFVAGLAPALLLTSQLITALKNIKTAGAFLPSLGPLLKGGLAVAGGALLGDVAARGLANAGVKTGDLGRVAQGEDPLKIVGERLAQGAVVLANGLLTAFKPAIEGAAFIGSLLQNGGTVIANGFDAFKALMQKSIGELNTVFGNLFVQVANNFSGLFDTTNLRQFGQNLQTVGELLVTDAQSKLATAGSELQQPLAQAAKAALDAGDAFDKQRTEIVTGLGQFLGVLPPVEQAADQTAQALDTVTQAANPLVDAFNKNQEALEKAATDIVKLKKDEQDQTDKQKHDRNIQATREEFDFGLQRARANRDAQKQMAQDDADFYRNRERSIADFNKGIQNEDLQNQQQIAKTKADNAEQEVRLIEDHGKRLLQIEQDTNRAVQDAASSLDAIGVQRALEAGQQQVNNETDQFDTAKQRRQQDQQQQIVELTQNQKQQRDQRIADFQQQLVDAQEAHDLQRQRQLESIAQSQKDQDEDRALRLSRQKDDFAYEDAQRRAALNKQITDIINGLAQETGIRRAWLNSFVDSLVKAGGHVADFASFVNQAVAQLPGGGQTKSTPTNRFTPTQFAGGGNPPLNTPVSINEQGLESARFANNDLALFTRPATIIPAAQTAGLLAGQGSRFSFGTGAIQLNFGDIGKHSPQDIEQLVFKAMSDTLAAVKAKIG